MRLSSDAGSLPQGDGLFLDGVNQATLFAIQRHIVDCLVLEPLSQAPAFLFSSLLLETKADSSFSPSVSQATTEAQQIARTSCKLGTIVKQNVSAMCYEVTQREEAFPNVDGPPNMARELTD